MTEAHITRERDRIQGLIKEYQSQGYNVVVEPLPHELPDFLVGYRPDLIVTRGGETTIVEVKSRWSLATEAQARELARLVENKPGWNFELVVVSDEPVVPPVGSVAFDRTDVQRTLKEARSLVDNGFIGPALLSGWATLEATLRLLMNAEGVEPRRLASTHLLKQAVEEGIISRDDYRALSDSMARRNALAHGFHNESVSPTLISRLLDLVQRLLNETSSPQSI